MLIFAAFLGGLVLFFGAILFVAERGASPIGPAIASVGGPFHLEDQNGIPVTDADMKGRPFLVFFGFTHCPDICPTTLFDMSQVMKALGPDANKIGALFITVDPQRDTPAGDQGLSVEFRSASARVDRRSGLDRCGGQSLSGLCQESSAGKRRLHDGPHRHRLSDGQGRPFRRAVQHQGDAGSGSRGIAPLSVTPAADFIGAETKPRRGCLP